jgi:hypothetical protein
VRRFFRKYESIGLEIAEKPEKALFTSVFYDDKEASRHFREALFRFQRN